MLIQLQSSTLNRVQFNMIIYTSHYAELDDVPSPVAISVEIPKTFQGKVFAKLMPTRVLESTYKAGEINEEDYTQTYLRLLENRGLTPADVVQHLPFRCTLMCWEKPYQFCHRHVVAKWIHEGTGIIVKEYGSRFIGGGLGIKI